MTKESLVVYDVTLDSQALEISVQIQIPASSYKNNLLLRATAWTPGDYEFLPFARDLFNVRATKPNGDSIPVNRDGVNSYSIDSKGQDILITYTASCYEPEMGDAMGILDSAYAALMGTRYLYVNDYYGPIQVTYHPPKDWPIHHPSGAMPSETPNTWIYPSYEILLDTPVIFGDFDLRKRTIKGVTFYYIFVDKGVGYESQVDAFVNQVSTAVEKIHDVFGLFPFDDYTFVLSLNPQADWGLEHLTSNLSGLGPEVFVDPAAHASGIRVCAHELFHAWNVRRLRPAPLGRLSHHLCSGSFTQGLWMAEGFTRYYEFLISARAQAYSVDQFFSAIVGYYQHLVNQPASRRVTATDSSLSTYLNHSKYPGRVNNSIDYYDKGMLIAFGLDVHFRTKGIGDLDAAFREFYLQYFGDGDTVPPDYVGYTTRDVLDFFERIDTGLGDTLNAQLNGVCELPVVSHLESLGFQVLQEKTRALGLFFLNDQGPSIYGVANDGAAGQCGIAPEDEITGINGFAYNWSALTWVAAQPEPLQLEILRGHRRLTFTLTPQPHTRIVGLRWNGTDEQASRIRDWLDVEENGGFSPYQGQLLPVSFYENFHGIENFV